MKSRSTLTFIFTLFLGTAVVNAQPGFTKHIISDTLDIAKKVYAVDIDSDGDVDVVAAASNQSPASTNIALFENNGSETFTFSSISKTYLGARGVYAGDLISGGKLEILAGNFGNDRTAYWKFSGGSWVVDSLGVSTAPQNYSLLTFDLNNDGNLDVLTANSAPGNDFRWFQNNGTGTFTEHFIATSIPDADDIDAGDIDGDGFFDVVGTSFSGNEVSWWKNDGTPENGGWVKKVIQSSYSDAHTVDLIDMDRDGDLDVLSVSFYNGRLSWWANDGNGNFGTEQVILSSGFTNARSALGADVDGDGDMDVVAAGDLVDLFAWFENDGTQNFTIRVIDATLNRNYFAFPVDLDGDGDMDVVGSAEQSNTVAWYENDLDDAQTIVAGDAPPTSFWNGKVSIDFSAGTSGLVTVFYNAGSVPDNTSLSSAIDHVATNGYYTITTQKTSYTASIDFFYGAGNVNEWSNITNESQLVICLWNETTGQWEVAGTSQTVDAANNKITVTGITTDFKDFSRWTLGSRTTDNPLPVELIAFNAASEDGGILLSWRTASEINNAGFEIWRADSRDTIRTLIADFTTNPELRGAGNSSTGKSYQFLDNDVTSGNRYTYQLADVDINGFREFLQILSIEYSPNDIPEKFVLGQNYPNPFNGVTQIPLRISGGNLSRASLSPAPQLIIYDINGRVVKIFPLRNLSPGVHLITWDGRNDTGQAVASGVYFYTLKTGRQNSVRKLMLVK